MPRRGWTLDKALAVRLALIVPLLALVYSIAQYSAAPGVSIRPAGLRAEMPLANAVWRPLTNVEPSRRLVYQYSVVPGGVRDVAELSQAVSHDPDVAFHYASFNFRRAHVVRLAADEKMFISYRRQGRIYWTKTAHLIRAGEKVITDGKVTARARCGNRLASKPEGLTAPDEPSEAQLNQPVAVAGDPVHPPALLARNSSLLPPLSASGPSGTGPGGFPVGIGPIIGGGGGVTCETQKQIDVDHHHVPVCPTDHHNPPPAVPEPGTYLLVGSGILILAYRSRNLFRDGAAG